jgi:hypothetical protein
MTKPEKAARAIHPKVTGKHGQSFSQILLISYLRLFASIRGFHCMVTVKTARSEKGCENLTLRGNQNFAVSRNWMWDLQGTLNFEP